MARTLCAVQIHYRLAFEDGGLSRDVLDKRWYFEIPQARDDSAAWHELLNRIFYDHNVAGQRSEPGDRNWLAIDQRGARFEVTRIDARAVLAWSGETDEEHLRRHLPWHLPQLMGSFGAVCWWVDDEGRYDGMEADDFTELVALGQLEAGEADEAEVVALLDALRPGQGAALYADRETRLANIACVRPTSAFRKPPGEPPFVSGPPSLAHVLGKEPERSPQHAPPPSPPASTDASASDEDVVDEPPQSSRLLHPVVISLVLTLLIVATCVLVLASKTAEQDLARSAQSAEQERLEPLQEEWAELRAQARTRLRSVAAILDAYEPPREDGCASLDGAVTVVHRPWVSEVPTPPGSKPKNPPWLSSSAWLHVVEDPHPRGADRAQRRNELVREALSHRCLVVFESDRPPPKRLQEDHRFDVGNVSGLLRVVCTDDPRVACEIPLPRSPREASAGGPEEPGSSAADPAARTYWAAVEVALAERAPALELVRAGAG